MGGIFLVGCFHQLDVEDQNNLLPNPTGTHEASVIRPSEVNPPAPIQIALTPIPTPSELPLGFEPGFPLDGIFPIYNPHFVTLNGSPLADEELVLGIAWEGEAKAYPVSVLRFREMANDELAGIPVLVTY